ncbi:MAG: RNase adapter RapZ [Deferribacteraceae bacterium]|jgi:UPF0042 nucleotide-binding protein|nr:RNase adapter RapZ [Deferribacteraceae bacterium]
MEYDYEKHSLVVVTGLSGAGKSTVSNVLEDIGYYTIDNMPVKILEKIMGVFFDMGLKTPKIALIIDSRSGDEQTAFRIIGELKEKYKATVLFLSASTEVIMNRYKASRRKHPLEGEILEAIKTEEELLKDIRTLANILLDTTELNVHELAACINSFFREKEDNKLLITFSSFGFKHGIPLDSDLVIDARFLKNPYFYDELKDKRGTDQAIKDFLLKEDMTHKFLEKLSALLEFLIPQYIREGKQYLKVSIGCTAGHHRSVAISEEIAKRFSGSNATVQITHRDIDKE